MSCFRAALFLQKRTKNQDADEERTKNQDAKNQRKNTKEKQIPKKIQV